MLVFIDESGDAGFKFGGGSSTHFVVTGVFFANRAVADACDAAITEFRRTAGLSDRFEFHFSQTRSDIVLALPRKVEPFEFVYSAFAIDKTLVASESNRRSGPELFSDLAGLVLRSLPGLEEAVVVIDGEQPKPTQSKIEKRLKEVNQEHRVRLIKKIKFSRSKGNNLLQLADAVSGAVFRSLTKGDETFRSIIRRRERVVETRS